MDLIDIKPADYTPNKVLEGFDSKVWKERYDGDGSFELSTYDVDYYNSYFIENYTMLSLADSREMMMVKSKEITRDDDGVPKLVVRGVSMTDILNDRSVINGVANTPRTFQKQYTSLAAAAVLAHYAVADYTVRDRTAAAPATKPINYAVGFGLFFAVAHSSNNPNLATADRWIQRGPLKQQFDDLLRLDGGGVRMVRPVPGAAPSGQVTVADDGTFSQGATDATRGIMQVYNGVNRTQSQNTFPPVVFSAAAQDFTQEKYISSSQNLKTVAFVTSSAGTVFAYRDDVYGPSQSGYERRELYVDAGTVESTGNWQSALTQRGKAELAKYNRQRLIDAPISEQTRFKYGVNYGLGDLVTVKGDYDFTADMYVTEYVRTESGGVEGGYPALSITL